MIDPAWIALGGTLIGGLFFKYLETWFAEKHVRKEIAGSISFSSEYKDRWMNPRYVSMIHDTMRKEHDALGQVYTVCKCPPCTAPKPEPVTVARKVQDALEGKPMCLDCEWGNIEVDALLDSASTFRSHMCSNCLIKELNREAEKNRRAKAIEAKASYELKVEAKPLTIFTASGPKQITELEFRRIAREQRDR